MTAAKPWVIQSIVVSKTHPDVQKDGLRGARRVVLAHGGTTAKVDTTATSYRFRQHDPSLFEAGSFRTLSLPRNGPWVVRHVSGHLKRDVRPRTKRR